MRERVWVWKVLSFMEEKKKETRWWDLCFFLISLNLYNIYFYSLRSYTIPPKQFSFLCFPIAVACRTLRSAQLKKAKPLNAIYEEYKVGQTQEKSLMFSLFFLIFRMAWGGYMKDQEGLHTFGWLVCVCVILSNAAESPLFLWVLYSTMMTTA